MNLILGLNRAALAGVCAGLLLASCSFGPRYARPKSDLPPKFMEADAVTYDPARPPASVFWHAFNDPVLDQLIDTALAHNKTLAQALAQVGSPS